MIKQAKRFYEFGPFRIDAAERLLMRGQQQLPLTPKAFDTLLLLVENNGHVLEKDELMKKLWPDTFVEEANLTNNISLLRKAIGENSDGQQYIKTVPRRGYCFVANVRQSEGEDTETAGAEQAGSGSGDSVEETKSFQNGSIKKPWGLKGRVLAACLAVITLAALTYILVSTRPVQPAATTAFRSIAVLPFKPLDKASRDEVLELGMADTLITILGRTRQIVVRPTGAIRKYTSIEQDPIDAGVDQGVDVVLEGTIHISGDSIRVNARLWNVSDGTALWAETFEEKFTNMFAVQDSISKKVAGSLSLRLTGEERNQLTKRQTESVEAFQLYVEGFYFARLETTDGVNKGISYLTRATEIDPNYALAYAGLSEAYRAASEWLLPPNEAMPKAKLAAEQALKIDPQLPEAHARLAWVKMLYEWDWPGAERHFNRAIELNPNKAEFHHNYAWLLSTLGQHEKALAEASRAEEISPVTGMSIVPLYNARRFDQLIEKCMRILAQQPNSGPTLQWLGLAYEQKELYSDAIAAFEKARRLDDSPDLRAWIGHVYALTGQKSKALKVLSDLRELSQRHYVSPFFIATIYIGLGEKDHAFEWLERAFEARSYWLIGLKVSPIFDGLRSDPRFQDLMYRVGLAQ